MAEFMTRFEGSIQKALDDEEFDCRNKHTISQNIVDICFEEIKKSQEMSHNRVRYRKYLEEKTKMTANMLRVLNMKVLVESCTDEDIVQHRAGWPDSDWTDSSEDMTSEEEE